jgi:hypothetical protein
MLCQPRAVRRSFVVEVVDRETEDPHAQERWMLLAPDAVRRSYVQEVLGEKVERRT